MENQKTEKEITLSQLFSVFKKSFILMLVAAMLLGAVGVAYSMFVDKPKYKATVDFWVNNTSSDYDYTSQAQTSAAVSLAASCVSLVNQYLPVERAVKNYGLTEKLGYATDAECIAAIRKMVSATKGNSETVQFSMTVTSGDREKTFLVAEALQSVLPGVLDEICGLKENEKNAPRLIATTPVVSVNDVVMQKSSPIVTGFILAFVAAVAVYVTFFVISIFDTTVYGEETIKENLSYPIVGNVPSWGDSDGGAKKIIGKNKRPDIVIRNYDDKLIGEGTPFFVSEAFNTLRTNVIYSAAAAKNPIFAITSDVAGVGKTVMAANLSIALANLGKKVLLVECDMRCPAFEKIFKNSIEKKETGVSELLAGITTSTKDSVAKYKNIDLDILTCGQIPPNPSELLSGYRMSELAEEWRAAYDYVILDMPPIGEVFDAGVVSSVVNGYILAVRCLHSNINEVKSSVSRIEALNGNIFGIILNDISSKSGKKYGYYYGSSYARASKNHASASSSNK